MSPRSHRDISYVAAAVSFGALVRLLRLVLSRGNVPTCATLQRARAVGSDPIQRATVERERGLAWKSGNEWTLHKALKVAKMTSLAKLDK